MKLHPKPRPALVLCAILLGSLGAAAFAQGTERRAASGLPQTPPQWRNAAVRDIQAGYKITVENHPGTFDRTNPGFLKNLKAAKLDGLKLAVKVQDAPGYAAALQAFSTRIHDGHAGMVAKLDSASLPPERWPGFVTVWRGDALYVAAADSGQPAIGAKVTSCDGLPLTTLIARNVFAFQGRVNEPGQWWVRAREVFLDRGNPFIHLPTRCEFQVGGQTSTQALNWVPIGDQAKRWREATYNGDQLTVGISEPRTNLFWVAMPSFQPDEKQRSAYRAMVEDVLQQRQRYLDADAIVIDLRHNRGGSSAWSQSFAKALWGEGRVERRSAHGSANTEVWWRVSKDNTAYVESLVGVLGNEGQVEMATWAKGIAAGMRVALKNGQKFHVEKDDAPAVVQRDANSDVAGDPAALTKPVYVVVPGQCASACLDALDIFTRFPNTKLIGAPSSADSTYMDVRMKTLDSGLATVIIPNKMYVNRARANGQFYVPAIHVRDLEWSTADFLAAVERDLRQPAK
jgi:Peptidase family S41